MDHMVEITQTSHRFAYCTAACPMPTEHQFSNHGSYQGEESGINPFTNKNAVGRYSHFYILYLTNQVTVFAGNTVCNGSYIPRPGAHAYCKRLHAGEREELHVALFVQPRTILSQSSIRYASATDRCSLVPRFTSHQQILPCGSPYYCSH